MLVSQPPKIVSDIERETMQKHIHIKRETYEINDINHARIHNIFIFDGETNPF